MYANTIVFLCSLFATIKDCTSSNIFSYLGSKVDSPYGIPRETRTEIENIYIQSLASDIPRDDPVCSLTVERKNALCELIFQITFYRNVGVYLNIVALHLAKLPCEEKIVSFKRRSDLLDKTFEKKMYPCRGRHKSVGTSFIEDNYYDKFYVSEGPDLNSVTVYVHEYNTISDWYTVYDYIHNVHVSELRDMFITVQEVTAELTLNKTIISTLDQQELENIFVREQDYYANTDPICNLEYERKITLCKIVFNSPIYREVIHIIINKAAVYLLDTECEKNPVFIGSPEFNSPEYRVFEQSMYPCYGRKDTSNEFILADGFLKRIYVSRGPRKNSVFVYLRRNVGHEDQFHLIDLLENVYTRDLKPTEITDEELVEESPTTYLKMRKLIEKKERNALLTEMLTKSRNTFENPPKNINVQFATDGSRKKCSQKRTDEYEQTFGMISKSIEGQEKTDFQKRKNPDLIKPTWEEVTVEEKEFLLGSSMRVQMGAQVMERWKAKKRETEQVPKTYFEASASSERLRKKLEHRKLMEKGKSAVAEKKLEEEVEKLIKEMEESLPMEGTEGKLPEKGTIPERNEEEVKEPDEKDSTEADRKKTKKKR